MTLDIAAFGIALLISSILSGIASIIAWRRSVPGALALSLLMFFMMIWSGSYAVQWLVDSPALKLVAPNFAYIGIVSIPTLFLVFSLSFVNQNQWFRKQILLLLAIEPLITLILVWTNGMHRLMFKSVHLVYESNIYWVQISRGPWYTVNVVYSYIVILCGLAVLIYGMMRSSPLLRHQNRILLLGAFLPWGISIYSEYVANVRHIDFTPLVFGISGILFTYSVLRNRFMDIIPLARSRIIESMSDGVLVLDAQNRVADINPAMGKLLNLESRSYLGKPAAEFLRTWLEQSDVLNSEEEIHTELHISNSPSRYLDLKVTPIYDQDQRLNGRLMVFRDVTDRKLAEKKLRSANDRLQSQLIEIGTLQSKLRSQAIRDPLTDLFNRRYLDETLDRELARAGREGYPVCVIMLDIDHFKKLNDTYGHEAGDYILKALARTLSTHNRRGDFVCRFGGEEFVVVMPNIPVEVAYKRAQDLRGALNSLDVSYEQFHLSITISMGIAGYPTNGEDRESVLRAADRAMYAAKRAGRDHILTYDLLQSQREMLAD
jgi:diguanylate cyclase (GGDEF)-like protein/PAS domain S-box-containing protein